MNTETTEITSQDADPQSSPPVVPVADCPVRDCDERDTDEAPEEAGYGYGV